MVILPLRIPSERNRLHVEPFNFHNRGRRRRINQKWILLPLYLIIILSLTIQGSLYFSKMWGVGEYTIKTTDYDAVIIGAGWAGLKAAQTLLDDGFSSILILEANDYIGGRAKSINTKGPINSPNFIDALDNLPIEMGCEWLYLGYGDMANVLLHSGVLEPLLAINGKKKKSINFHDAAYYAQNVNADGVAGSNLIKNITTLKERVWDNFYTNRKVYANRNESFADGMKEYKKRNNLSTNEENYLNLMRSIIGIEYGGDAADISGRRGVALAAITYYTSIPGLGYGNIAGKYAESFKSKIKLNANVIEVNYSDEQNNIITYVEDGTKKKVSTATVLATVPLGVLKANSIKFIPTFPEWKQEAIDNMGVGVLNKCIMQWRNPSDVVWPRDKYWLELIASDEASSDKWTSFFNPTSFKNVPVLVGFIGGRAAIDAESQTDDEILEDVMRNLKAMYPSIRKPDTVVITRWGKEPTARGSYAFTKVNRSWGHDKDNLRKRINNLWFAGEATYRTPGSTVAAWKTGETAAKSMASALSEKSAIRYNTPLHG